MANEAEEKPTLRNIRLADLQRLSRLRALYTQATAAKWLTHTEANFRNFTAAAARAIRVDGDAVRIFIGIVRRGLWHHLTTADEDRATRALRREQERQLRTAEKATAEKLAAGEGAIVTVLNLAMRCTDTGDLYASGAVLPRTAVLGGL